jgi:hypothetical protein
MFLLHFGSLEVFITIGVENDKKNRLDFCGGISSIATQDKESQRRRKWKRASDVLFGFMIDEKGTYI